MTLEQWTFENGLPFFDTHCILPYLSTAQSIMDYTNENESVYSFSLASEFSPSNSTQGRVDDTLANSFSTTPVLLITTAILTVVNVAFNTLNVLVACNERFSFPISNRVAIVSMSVADILVGLSVIFNATFYRWRRAFCRSFLVLAATSARASMLSLIFVIIDRYLVIVYPYRHQRYATKRNSISVMLIAWLLTLTVNIVENVTGHLHYDPRRGICVMAVSATSMIISFTLELVTPISMMIIVYFRLLQVVRGLSRNMARIYPASSFPKTDIVVSTVSVVVADRAGASQVPANDARTTRRDRRCAPHHDYRQMAKVTLTFFAITLAFILTRTPVHIVRMVAAFRGSTPEVSLIVSRLMFVSGSWWNIIIFSLFNREFRATLIKLFKK